MNKNPPAFPRPYFRDETGEWSSAQEGMTLRDYFAGQALAGLCASKAYDDFSDLAIASKAYDLAGAMLRIRKDLP